MTTRPLDPVDLPLTGQQLIEASAGTGKTYTITTIVLRLLLERELTLDRIVVVTFTNAATAELRDRVRRRIVAAERAFWVAARGGDGGAPPNPERADPVSSDPVLAYLLRTQKAPEALQRLRAALRSMDRAAIFTIHGFAQRVLQEHAFESGARFELELVGEQRAIVGEVAHDFWAREVATLSEEAWQALQAFGVTFASFVSLAYVAAVWSDLPLHPEVAEEDPGDLTASLQEVSRAWEDVAQAYRYGGLEAFELLASPGLNKTYYGPERLIEHRRELEVLLTARPSVCKEIPRAVKCLAAGNIKANKHHRAPEHPLFDSIARLESTLEACRVGTGRFVDTLRRRLVSFARERVASEHERAGTRSFDDLLYALREALREEGKGRGASLARQLRSRYPAALIDEFQDTDPVQYEIFRRIYGGSSGASSTALFLVGDPKQAIYAFRGADIHAYLEAARTETGGRWTLTTNYRSDPGFVGALNHLFGRLEQPFLHEEIRYARVDAAPGRQDALFQDGAPASCLEILYLGREEAGRSGSGRWDGTEEWQRLTAREIARLLSSRLTLTQGGREVPLQPRHIAVLTRTNRQAQEIQEQLRTLGIPSVLQGDRTVFETSEAGELALILRALAEPSSASAVRTALATRFLGLDARGIAALAEDEIAWESWTLRFREWNGIWVERGLVQCLEALLRDLKVVQRTLGQLDGERRMTNLRHLFELLHQAECEKQLRIPGLLQWFDEARLDPSRQGMAPEAQQLRLESDAEAVVLTTMHKSKGLEYPIVVLPFLGARSEPFGSELENLKFHNPDHGDRLELDVRAKEHKSVPIERFTREHRAEAMRLAYVALTRARHRCLVLWGGVSSGFSSLGYLLHQPAEALGGLAVDVATRLHGLDDAARFGELEALSAASGGTIRVRRARLEQAAAYEPTDRSAAKEPRARRLRRPLPNATHTSSFTGLTRGLDLRGAVSPSTRDGRDVDEGTESGTAVSAHEVSGTGDSAKPSSVTLAEFPRGAKPGELLHSILEKAPFAEGDAAARQLVVETELRRHGFDRAHLPVVQRALEEILATPLDEGSDWTLGSLPPSHRVSEMEFTLPVVLDPTREGLSARDLAEVLSGERDAPWDRRYTRRVARLGFRAWSGFLRGFVDLIFERDGAYYLLDYKSNHLGPSPDDFRRERLHPVLDEHHYHLQYVLYSVALHRYLRRRLPDYSIERHWGGVYYLFLRGMHPATGAERGVFFYRPSPELIQRVSASLGAEGDGS